MKKKFENKKNFENNYNNQRIWYIWYWCCFWINIFITIFIISSLLWWLSILITKIKLYDNILIFQNFTYFLNIFIYILPLIFVFILIFVCKHIIITLIFLFLLYISIGGLLIFYGLEFLGFMFIIIYSSGIIILFLFVVMTLDTTYKKMKLNKKINYWNIISFLIISNFYFLLHLTINKSFYNDFNKNGVALNKVAAARLYNYHYLNELKKNNLIHNDYVYDSIWWWHNDIDLFERLYTSYCLYFLIIGFFLLLTLIGSVFLINTIDSKFSPIKSDYNLFAFKNYIRVRRKKNNNEKDYDTI